MDQKTVAFARSRAARYVRTKHPYGLDVEEPVGTHPAKPL